MRFYHFALLLLTLFCLSSAVSLNERFDEVLKNITDAGVKAKLSVFEKEGIEISVDTANYNSEEVIEYAKSFLGTRHKMRGTTKAGIDCSGLVMVSHKKYGVVLPHSAQAQAHYGQIIPAIESLKRGDLVFFCHSYSTSAVITHSGIYLGNGKFIHASVQSGVITSSINDAYYWKKKFLFGTRFKN